MLRWSHRGWGVRGGVGIEVTDSGKSAPGHALFTALILQSQLRKMQ